MSQPVETTEQLSAEDQRRLLAEMLQKKAIRAIERPLSLGQERLWLMARLDPESFRYNIAVAYRLVGPLDLTALEQAVRRIAERHEVLRATFTAGKGQPVQRIGRDVPGVFTVAELAELPADERMARAARLAIEEAKRPFDLAKGPLWRVKVFRNSTDDHVIVVVMHHIVSDAWSFFVFGRELAEFYEASIAGRAPRLADLPISYADFGQRQRRWLSGQVYEQQLAHWRTHLEGNVPRLLLPTDRPGSAAISHRGAFQTLAIPANLREALGQICRRENTTTFMTLLAAFEILLHNYSGQEDLILCTPASGRHRSQTKELIGYFNNLLPMRFDLSGDPTFAEVVRRTRKVTLDAFKYQDLPFQVIADAPNLKAVSLARVLFSLDIEWPPKLTLAGLASEVWAVRTETADFDLSVSLWLDGDEIRGVFEYKTELFDDETIGQMIADYRESLEALAENPEATLSSLPARAKPDAELRTGTAGRNTLAFKPPRSFTELRIVTEWEDILGIRPIGVDHDLFELGATSLAVARLSERLQAMFPVTLPLAAIFQARTVSRIATLVREGGSVPSGPALAPIRPNGTYPPLFVCEGIGIYYGLTRHLASEQPVYALVTEIGADDPSIGDRAAAYIAKVRTVQPEGPYYLAGLSFGGIVAFEMAQQFRAAGQEVALLAFFDTPTPWAFSPHSLPLRLAGHLSNLWRFGFSYVEKKIGRRLKSLKRRFRTNRAAVASPASATLADTDRLRQLLTTTADRYTLSTYPGRATLFVLAERDGMSDSLFDPALGKVDRELGWGRVIAGGVDVYEIAGEHTTIFQEPNVRILAEKLTSCLETARVAAST